MKDKTMYLSSRPNLPPAAEAEILEKLSADMRISAAEIAAILKKHGVTGDPETLQDSYRKRLGQQNRGPRKATALWGEEEQGSAHSFCRQVETELSGLCDDESSIRDESGRREVFAAKGGQYVVVECCSDRQQLKAIRRRIQGQISGLDVSAGKVQRRLHLLDQLMLRFGKAG